MDLLETRLSKVKSRQLTHKAAVVPGIIAQSARKIITRGPEGTSRVMYLDKTRRAERRVKRQNIPVDHEKTEKYY